MSDEPLEPWMKELLQAGKDASVPSGAKAELRESLVKAGAFAPGALAPPDAASVGSAAVASPVLTHALALLIGLGGGAGLYHVVAGARPAAVVEPLPPRTPNAAADVLEVVDAGATDSVSQSAAADSAEVEAPPNGGATQHREPDARPTTMSAESNETSSPPVSALADERRLIDRALAARRAGELHAAMVALMEHQRRFDEGLLREERERMAIETLASLGRDEPARRRAQAFLTRYPSSPHAERVRSILADL